ncbi:hypothetical protein BGX31_002313 [Mortierella sp. GBA43]|nr:hypothetical protein BGX31_002313 [Mortierella sp. GBA43]
MLSSTRFSSQVVQTHYGMAGNRCLSKELNVNDIDTVNSHLLVKSAIVKTLSKTLLSFNNG